MCGLRPAIPEWTLSSFSSQAAALVEEWNRKLNARGIELKAAREIDFGDPCIDSERCTTSSAITSEA